MGSAGLYPRNRKFVDQSNPFTNKIFQDAVIRGDLAVIAILLKYGIVLRRNERNHQGLTALQQSVLDGNLRLAVRLLENGADLESKTSNGWSCLHIAAATGDVAMIHLLLVHCADVVALTKNEELPIDVAASLEAKLMLAQQLAKSGYSELAQWYTNRIASRELENSTTMSPNHVIENACHSNSSSDINLMPYCTHNMHQLPQQSTLKHNNVSDPEISCISHTKFKQRKLSCLSLNQATKTKESEIVEDRIGSESKRRGHSPSYSVPLCGECGQLYVPEYEDPCTFQSDLVYMSCSSGYLSESNTDSRQPNDLCRHIGSHNTSSMERNSIYPCSPDTEIRSFDKLRPVSSNPVISTSPETRRPDNTRTLPRVSRKPSCSTIPSERKLSASQNSALERKRSRVELFIDYYRDSLDGQLSDEDENEQELGFILGSDDDNYSTDEDSDSIPQSPDHYPSYPDQVSTVCGLEEIQAMSILAEADGSFHNENSKLLQQESFQFLLDAMDRDVELPEQNMYFNPMYKSPPESSADSQERLSRDGYSNLAMSGIHQHDRNAWQNSMASIASTRSSSSSRADKRRKKKNILSGIVSRLRDTVKMSRSSSDPELTDGEETVVRRDSTSVTSIKDKRGVRRSNSFSSYFGSLFDSQQIASSSPRMEAKENIDPTCEYPEDYYFVDKSGQMMKKCKRLVRSEADGSEFNPVSYKINSQSCPNPRSAGFSQGFDCNGHILKDRQDCFSPPSRENYRIDGLVTPRPFRREFRSKNRNLFETGSQNILGNHMDIDDNDSWNLYPHTIILNNGSLSPDTDDPEASQAANFQCSCRDCVSGNSFGGNHIPMARNTYHRRCQPILAGVSTEQGDTTTCMSFKFLCK